MILYIEPFSGLAGDMLLSALATLADAHDELRKLPEKLGLADAELRIQQLDKNGIVCKHIKIVDTGEHHHSESDHHHHRHLSDILEIIDRGDISDRAKSIAKTIFQILGESESRIHDVPLERIHFHEVSGVDSILDIVGCATLIDRLDIAETYCDPICIGFGQVKTQHGLLPVPAPATADILRGFPTYKGEEPGERCTPTGAAILKYLNPRFEPCPLPIARIAYGPGEKDFNTANVVRVSELQSATEETPRQVWIIETNLDDLSPEQLGASFQEGLLASGALDFHLAPIQMKKGRPAFLLSAMSSSDSRDRVIDFILENTSAIGLRYYLAQRRILERRKIAIDTKLGTVLAKETTKPSGAKQLKLEFDSLERIARETTLSFSEVKRRIEAELYNDSQPTKS